MNVGENLRSIVMTLSLIACEAHTGKPQPSATPTAPSVAPPATGASPVPTGVSAGQPCSPSASTPLTILDTQGNPVDMTNEESVSKAMGQPVLVCAPVRRALAGRVIDADTKSPVADATVTVESWETPAPIGGLHERRHLLHSISARTDALGNWAVPAQSDWMPGILAADGLPFFIDSWCVSANGYETRTSDPWKQPAPLERSISEIAVKRGIASTTPNDKTRTTCGLLVTAAPAP
jgi:hypothetical protein